MPTPLAALPNTVWKWIGGFIATFLVVTIAHGVLLATVVAMTDSGDDVTPDSDESSSFQVAIFALVHAWTGHLGIGSSSDEFSGGAGVVFPLGVLAMLGLAALAWAARWLTQSFRPTSRAAMWGQVAAAVGGCVVILVVLGLIGRPSDDEFYISALGFGAVFRVVFLLTLAAVVGAALAVPRGQRIGALFGSRASHLVGHVWSSIDAALIHVVAWSGIGLLVGLVLAVVWRDDVPFGISVAYVIAAIPAAMTWGHLGGIGLSGSGSQDMVEFLPESFLDSTTLSLFSEETHAALWLLPLPTVAVVVLLAVRLTLLREPGSSIDVRHLATTPFALVIVWFVMIRVMGRMGADLSIKDSSDQISGDFAVGPVWWTFVLLVLTGIVIELVHAFLGVRLVQLLPRSLVQRVVPRPNPAWGPYLGGIAGAADGAGQPSEQTGPSSPPAQPESSAPPEDQPTVRASVVKSEGEDSTTATGVPAAAPDRPEWAAPAQSWSASGTPQWGQPQPVSRRSKIVAGGVVGALVLGVLAWIVLGQIGKRYFGPEGVALDYASAVVDGRASDAIEAGQINVADRHRLLLTDDVYQSVDGPPAAAEVTDVEESEDGESATVTLEFEQGGQRFTQTVEADRAGRQKLFFPKWELQPVELPSASLTVAADKVEVGDQTVDLAEHAEPDDERLAPLGTDDESQPPSYRVNLPALPGKYSFGLPSTKFLEADPVEVSISADQTGGEDDGNYSEEGETLAAEPREALSEELDAQIKKKIDGCVSNFDENACPWDTSFDDTADYSKRSFTVKEYPSASVSSTDTVREGEEFSLDLGGSVAIEEEATCRTDSAFGCRRGGTTDTTQYLSSSGWSAVIKGDSVTVEWSGDTDWDF